jgi:effector-binding domain-containing protein
VIVHAGDHTDIDLTYGALATYVSERALAADGPIRETYVVGDDTSADQAARRTEIGWPIFHPGTAG